MQYQYVFSLPAVQIVESGHVLKGNIVEQAFWGTAWLFSVRVGINSIKVEQLLRCLV